ncbi:MAG: hypothetical protein AAFO79_09615, partial [Pseudomonadota bacterium]
MTDTPWARAHHSDFLRVSAATYDVGRGATASVQQRVAGNGAVCAVDVARRSIRGLLSTVRCCLVALENAITSSPASGLVGVVPWRLST